MNNADKLIALTNPTKAVLQWFKRLCLNDALRPAGGTRMRGSAHPKLPPCGRAAGVAKNLRVTPPKLSEPDPNKMLFVKPKPFRRLIPRIGRNQPCPCGSGKKWKACHMQAVPA